METAKVDIRKLQLLNDRIAQVAEALNQVRLSVHGLASPGAFGATSAFGGATGVAPFGSGLSHTSAFGMVPGMNPYPPINPYAQGINPYVQGISPFSGLSHTSAETIDPLSRLIWSDPLLPQRVAQTFPYAFSPYALPQVVSLT